MALTQCIFKTKTPDYEMSFSLSVLHGFLVTVSTIINPSIIRFMDGLVSERVSEWVDGSPLLFFIRGRILHSSTMRHLNTAECS